MSITNPEPMPEKTSVSRGGAVLALAVVAAMAMNVYLFSRVKRLEVEALTMQMSTDEEFSKVHEGSVYRGTQARRELEELRKQLSETHKQISKQAEASTRRRTRKLAESVSKQQRVQQEVLLGELRDVAGKAGQAQEGVTAVEGELETVKSAAEQTRLQLSKTGAALASTRDLIAELDGQMGEQGKKIETLQQLGERQRVVFVLNKSKQSQKVADLQLRLRAANPKRNRYSLDVIADDKKIQQKNKHLHEALRFYLPGSPQPYEIVVTQMTKNQVIGYVSKAKTEMARLAPLPRAETP